MNIVEIPVIRVRQNIGDLYIGVMNANDLYDIAEVDRIRSEKLEIPKYAGYQRALVRERVESIRNYLDTPESTFPNAIILSIDSEYIENWDDIRDGYQTSLIKLKKDKGAVRIIDGQHRAAALNAAGSEFQVIVSIFVDLELSKAAQIFAKINSTQRAVNPSIAFQLFGYAEGRSPQKTAHDIAEKLNTTPGSPFHKRLQMIGTKDRWSEGFLSQATFSKELMKLYSSNPEKDEHRLILHQKLDRSSALPLRDYFIEGNDQKILEVVWRFFFHVADTWKEQWTDPKSILQKTTGYAAFMQILKRWLLSERKHQVLDDCGVQEAFTAIREGYDHEDKKFVRQNYPAGNQGVVKLRDQLLTDLGLLNQVE